MWIFSLSSESSSYRLQSSIILSSKAAFFDYKWQFLVKQERTESFLTNPQMVIYLLQIVDLTMHKLLE